MQFASFTRRAGRVLTALLTLAAIALTLLVIAPRLLGYHTYAITSGSMTGAVDAGSLVISRAVPVEELDLGDVITYAPPADTGIDHLVTHRIVDIDLADDGTRTFRTKGDANQSDDPWTFALDAPTQARMSLAVPLAGRPLLLLADPHTRTIAIGVPAALIFLLAAWDFLRALRATPVPSRAS